MKKPKVKREWAKIKRARREFKPSGLAKFTMMCGHRKSVLGFWVATEDDSDVLIEYLKKKMYEGGYLPAKARLRHLAGVELGECQFIVKKADRIDMLFDPFNCKTTVGWKAIVTEHVTNKAHQRMMLAHRRARHEQ